MTTFLLIVILILGCALAVFYFLKQRAERMLAAARQEAELARQQRDEAVSRARNEAQAAMVNTQATFEQKSVELATYAEQIREYYETEARKALERTNEQLNQTLAELEPLRGYASLKDAEEEVRKTLADAVAEATALRQEAQELLEQTRNSAAEERRQAQQRAREIRGQAETVLMQATGDAGRIVADAEKRAEQIGGDAYIALRDKQTLEQAVNALWNVVEGYGDRYIIPTRSLLDDLAKTFGNTEAGEALRAAREHSRRMVELRQAATCNYEEADRRERANRFVVDAFNGRVDAILTRTKHDNYGTLEQEIRDAFSLVNLNGLAFRDARILPAYRDARLVELKWAVVVQELKLKEREEQREIQEQMREEEKVKRERDRAIQEAQKEEDMRRQAREAVQKQMDETIQNLRAKLDQANEEQRAQLEQEYQQQMSKLNVQLQEKDEKLREAEENRQRAISNAQRTRAGKVYIISNIGSFGEEVFKIGMTRREVAMDRIWELSDASVPFDFDVHAMIFSEDAPTLEHLLHDKFRDQQINKVNNRKEFFRLPLEQIRAFVAEQGLEATFTMAAEAREYRETLALEKMTPAEREKYQLREMEDEEIAGE